MQLEEAIILLKEMQDNALNACRYYKEDGTLYRDEKAELKANAIETVLQALDNSIPKKVIEEYKNEFIEESKNQETFMTHSSQISASLISFCKELLKHSQVTIK